MNIDPLYTEAAEPESLRRFIRELEADGFVRIGPRHWQGPTRASLIERGHADAQSMTVVIRPAWPYWPPLLEVPGIAAWHADQERLCIWQSHDNSQRWVTLQGLYDRIDEWALDAEAGFAEVENARNPEIYWQQPGFAAYGLVDLDELIATRAQDGQHGEFHFADAISADGRTSPVDVFDLRPGPFTAVTSLPGVVPAKLPDGRPGHKLVRGRWFFRTTVPHPPRTLEELRLFLSDSQRARLDKDLRDRPMVMFGLFWHNGAGLVGTVLLAVISAAGDRAFGLVPLRPKGKDALLLRAGPDALVLQQKRVAILGVGAIGSKVAKELTRSGLASVRLLDGDLLWPANLIRHGAAPGTPAATPKTVAMKFDLEQYPWIKVDIPSELSEGFVSTIGDLRDVLESADLTIDATGHGGVAELAARVATEVGRPYISAALFRGGAVARVRRQALPDDTPLVQRPHLDRYPEIPPLNEEAEYLGTETGCLAQIHNAPPSAVAHAATLAVEVVIDHLTGRHEQPDEIIEVMRLGDPPFDRLGRLRPEDLPITIDISETAQATLKKKAQLALPHETGGVVLGCEVDGRPTIAEVAEISDPHATPDRYRVPEGVTPRVVADARERDHRLGYLGEWHSHTSDRPPSPRDVSTMLKTMQQVKPARPVLVLVYPKEDGSSELSAFVATSAGLKSAEICLTGDLPKSTQEAT